MKFWHLTNEHRKQVEAAIAVTDKYYTPEERLEFAAAIIEKDAPEGIRHVKFFIQIPDHNTLDMERGDRYCNIDGSMIVSDRKGIRKQTLIEYKYNSGDHKKIIKDFEESNEFEHYMGLIKDSASKTLNVILAVHSSSKLSFSLGRKDKDRAIIIKVYKPSNNEGEILSTHDFDGMSVGEFKKLRRLEG